MRLSLMIICTGMFLVAWSGCDGLNAFLTGNDPGSPESESVAVDEDVPAVEQQDTVGPSPDQGNTTADEPGTSADEQDTTSPDATTPDTSTPPAPGFAYLDVDESADKLILSEPGGGFGPSTDLDLRDVTIGGTSLSSLINSWAADQIVVSPLSRTGAGSGGEVHVIVGDRPSTPRFLTRYNNVKLSWTRDYDAWYDEVHRFTHTQLTWTISFRADADGYRADPSQPSQYRDLDLWAIPAEAKFEWNFSGSGWDSECCGNQGTVSIGQNPAVGAPTIWAGTEADWTNNAYPYPPGPVVSNGPGPVWGWIMACPPGRFFCLIQITANPRQIRFMPGVYLPDAIVELGSKPGYTGYKKSWNLGDRTSFIMFGEPDTPLDFGFVPFDAATGWQAFKHTSADGKTTFELSAPESIEFAPPPVEAPR